MSRIGRCQPVVDMEGRPVLRRRAAGLRQTPWVLIVLVLLSGCGARQEISSEYGRRRGADRGRSVNGTGVLAQMFQQAGFHVTSWRRLSPKLENDQVIVWAPNDFAAPRSEQIAHLESWLASEPGRTLVYIGRDYDAAVDYWREILPNAAAQQRIEVRRKLAEARSRHHVSRHQVHEPLSCRWFHLDRLATPRSFDSLEGPWSRSLEATGSNLQLRTVLRSGVDPSPDDDEESASEGSSLHFDVLLAGNDQLLAARLTRDYWDNSQIIVVANGSWLLNLPLVNHEHRKLARQLIEDCGPADRVCFLESGPGGPSISDSDTQLPLMLRAFTVWPVNVVLLHLTLLGILFCFCVFPIFGRARQLPADSVSDFGKHVTAMGDLLERGGDAAYAQQRIQQYQELVHKQT